LQIYWGPVAFIVGLRNELIALPQVFGGLAIYRFAGLAVKRILGIGSNPSVGIGQCYQPMPTVIVKGGHQLVGRAARRLGCLTGRTFYGQFFASGVVYVGGWGL
jgi:hypothetical protein